MSSSRPKKNVQRPSPTTGEKKSRTREQSREANEDKILKAAEKVFAERGFSGATTAAIATEAGLPKANVHYYFRTKTDLFQSVLDNILDLWLDSADVIEENADPAVALSSYIRKKIEYSRNRPYASKVFAGEILHGAPHLLGYLRKQLHDRVQRKKKVIESWAGRGLIDPISPEHLFFLIWAATQTYADFDCQVAAVMGTKSVRGKDYDDAADFITAMVLKGCGVTVRGKK